MHVLLVSVYLLLTLFFACSPTGGPSSFDPKQKALGDRDGQLSRALVDELVQPRFSEMKTEVADLQSMIAAHCAELDRVSSSQEAQRLRAWQTRWERAAWNFHYLNLLVFGPLTQVQESTPLRFIYSHSPARAPSLIEREITKANEQKMNYHQTRPLAHSLGFQALEYLLFARPAQNLGLVFDEGACYYTRYLIQDLQERLQDYERQWLETEVAYLRSPEGQTRLPEVISRLAGHIIVHTREVLYRRSALAPLGLDSELSICPDVATCIRAYLEHPFATDRKIKLSAGLQALDDIFNGRRLDSENTSYSFRDYFIHLQRQGDHPLDQIRELKLAWQQIPAYDQILAEQTDPTGEGVILQARDFLDRFDRVNRWLGTDLLVDLNANLPKTVKGDND